MDEGPDPAEAGADSGSPDDPEADRQLALRRRELEREFEERRRQAKLQERRLRDSLAKDREDWERHRAEQAKALADRTEALRRQQESARKQTELKAQERQELHQTKAEVEGERARSAAAQAELSQRVEGLQSRLGAVTSLAAWMGALMMFAALSWLVLAGIAEGASWTRPASWVVACALGVAGAFLLARTRKA